MEQYLSKTNRHELAMLGEAPLGALLPGTIVEVKRKGFFICDQVSGAECVRCDSLWSHCCLACLGL